MKKFLLFVVVMTFALALLAACEDPAVAGFDGSACHDVGSVPDAAAVDGAVEDADAFDSSLSFDAFTDTDAGPGLDAAAVDGAVEDAGAFDSSLPFDGAVEDAAVEDAAVEDGAVASGPCEGFAPAQVIDGSYAIESSQDQDFIVDITCISGGLTVNATELTEVDLPALQSVGGLLDISNNISLTSVHFPVLNSVGGSLHMQGNASLTSLGLPALASVGGLLIGDSAALTRLGLPVLSSVELHLSIGSNASLTRLHLPELVSVGGALDLYQNPSLLSLDLGSLASVEQWFSVYACAALTYLDLPLLASVGGYHVEANPALTRLGFAVLASVDESLTIKANEVLPNCEASNLRDQVQAADGIGGMITIMNNLNVCDPDPCSSGTCAEDCSVPQDYYVCE